MEYKNTFFKTVCVIAILTLLSCLLSGITVYADGETSRNYQIIIEDNANLLTDEEETSLKEKMSPITEYGNVAFVSVSTNYIQTDNFAKSKYRDYFGTSSGTLFCIDMDNREIYIFSDGDIFKTINKNKAYEITDNIYTYATSGEYFECASKAYEQIYLVLDGGFLFVPMRYITGALFGIGVSLLFFIIVVYIQRRKKLVVSSALNSASGSLDVKTDTVMTSQRKTRHVESSSGGGGGGGGGGGSSGGGGGHSF